VALREILASFGYEIDHAELNKGEAGVGHMIESLRHLGRSVGEAFAAYEVKEFVEKTIEGALQLNHAAIIAGTTAEKLQSLQFAAEASEVPVDALSMGLMRLQRSMFASGAGAQGAGAAYAKLGLDQKELAKKETTEAFIEVAGAIGDIKDPAEQTATAMKIFGRGGAQLLPLMKKGEAGIRELREEVEKLGGGFTGEYIQAADKYHEASVRLQMSWRSFSVMITEKLVPAFTWLTDKATAVIHKITEMRSELDLGRIGMAGFVAVLVGGLRAIATMFGPMLAKLALSTAGFILLALVAEDLMGLFQGDESLSGTLIDHFFGPGAAKAFVEDVQAMTASWQLFKDGLATFAGSAGAAAIAWLVSQFERLGSWIAYAAKMLAILPARAMAGIAGSDAGDKMVAKITAQRDAEYGVADAELAAQFEANGSDFDRIRGAAAKARADNAQAEADQASGAGKAVQLGPGMGVATAATNMPSYLSQPQYFTDKSTTTISLMPGSTDAQAKAVGSAVERARQKSAGNRADIYALEPAVE
jgi:hypothetical protein